MVQQLPTGSVTLFFTDIEGSTRRWEHLPQQMSAALMMHDLILRASIEEHGGSVFKTIGDAFCAAFSDPADALSAALNVQRALAAERWGEVGPVRVRIALHTGEPEHRERDYFGPPVNRVARLLSTGYGEQTLLSSTAAAEVKDRLPDGAELVDLGAHRLKDLLQPERIFQLRVADLPAEFPPLKSLDNQPHNLPPQPTPLIGRDADVARVRSVLEADTRLVTLTGPGGTGKTRLALQVAADLIDSLPDGAWFVGLAPISDPGLVISAIAHPLGVREAGHEPLEQTLISYLRDKRLLLVLDNFEHVLGAAPVIGRLLTACRGITVLATSRSVLRVYGEREVAVAPLALPDPRRLPALEELAEIPSVALFVERAQAVKPDFSLSSKHAAAVAGICVRLEGLPLAIELAAARTRILPPDRLLERLSSRLDLLTGGAADRDDRQRTLRGAIAWSYDLLSPEDQLLFRRLSVFLGGTFEAIEAVCAADGAVDALDGLESLVQKSLLRQEEHEDGPRFFMLETIREYAQERLSESGEEAPLRQAHAEELLALAERAEAELTGPEQALWLIRIETDYANIRAALDWFHAQGEYERLLRLAAVLTRFWDARGYLSEGRSWLKRALDDANGTSASLRAKALKGAGALAHHQGDYDQARQLHESELAAYEVAGDQRGMAQALSNLGRVALDRGEYDAANSLFEEALIQVRNLGDRHVESVILNSLGILAFLRGDYDHASELYEASLVVKRELGDKQGIGVALVNVAETRQYQGDLERAVSLYHQALALFRELGDVRLVAFVLQGLGQIALTQGDIGNAKAFILDSMTHSHEMGDKVAVARCMEQFAQVAVIEKRFIRAAQLFGAVDVLREAIGAPRPEPYAAECDLHAAIAKSNLGPDQFVTAWNAGRRMSLDEATSEAARS